MSRFFTDLVFQLTGIHTTTWSIHTFPNLILLQYWLPTTLQQ